MKPRDQTARPPRIRLALECIAVFIGLPAAHALGWLPVPVIVLLLGTAAGCWMALGSRRRAIGASLLQHHVPRAEWRRILLELVIAVPLLAGLLWLARPEALFALVRQEPRVWLLFVLAYPLVSVLPQELIYRVFFFHRYEPLFGPGAGRIIASAAAFGFAHIVFHNWPAVGLTLLGGWLFGRTYQRTSSLLLVAVQHALYGAAVFTLGYHEFFLSGTLRLFQR